MQSPCHRGAVLSPGGLDCFGDSPALSTESHQYLPAFRAESSTPVPRRQGPSWALQATEHHLWPLSARCQQHPSSYDHQQCPQRLSPGLLCWGHMELAARLGVGREIPHPPQLCVWPLLVPRRALWQGDSEVRVWQVIRAGTMAPLTPHPPGAQAPWQVEASRPHGLHLHYLSLACAVGWLHRFLLNRQYVSGPGPDPRSHRCLPPRCSGLCLWRRVQEGGHRL